MRTRSLVGIATVLITLVGATPANAASRLVITEGGTPESPRVYDGTGKLVGGIDIKASNVIVRNYTMTKPTAPGIRAQGNNITLEANVITNPVNGDGDGIRFFGDNIKILRNTISGTSNKYGHADCMQTYATNTPGSNNVLIEGNRCEKIDNMCLMAEGPNEGEGSGKGHSTHFTIRGNFCETLKAAQALMFEDIQHATITGNEFAASPTKAIGLAIKSTHATVSDNKVSSGIRYEVGIDKSSMEGYKGPKPGGKP
ncbi:right-handed parallel beta-helix repeat-containing protein [Allokutzneria oryzae]|uniref:Right-handed parallel beta-helix repeat-containing protein n=1 Tax=Allokutzneria oryzae TaxID=1378989 RepID=A0ABV6A3E4_9PSEU